MKNQITYGFLLLVMISLLFTDCSVQKRKYRSGYYVSAKKKHPSGNDTKYLVQYRATTKALPPNAQREVTKVSAQQEMGLTASAQNTGREHTQKLSIQPLPMAEDSCGDMIVFLNGEEVLCRVMEVGTTNVMYKACDNLDGPLFTRAKQNIFMIKYQNGSKEVFKQKATTPVAILQPVPLAAKKKKMSGISLAAFIVSLFSWTLILAPVALVMGILGKNEVKRNPDTLKGDGFATAAVVLSSIVLFLVLLAILSVVFL
ncbi:MAG: DUF4190 domain-containing protein [Bacteroidia bacterium]|nr:DUF4190 domain-containing protein [Bacteroidia bacterium]